MATFTEDHVNDWTLTRVAKGLIDPSERKDASDWIIDQLNQREMVIDPKELKRTPFRSNDMLFASPVVYLWCGWLLNNPFSNKDPQRNGDTILKATRSFAGSRLARKGQLNQQNHADTVSIALSYMFGFNPNTVICQPVSIKKAKPKVWERKTQNETGFGERIRETINLPMWKMDTRKTVNPDGTFTTKTLDVTCPESKIDEMWRAVGRGDSVLFVRQAHGELTYKSQSVNNIFFLSVFRAVAHRIGETIGRQPYKGGKTGKPVNILTLESIPTDQWATIVDEPWNRIEPVDVFKYMEEKEISTSIDNRILMDHYQITECEGGTMKKWFEVVQSYTGIKNFSSAEKRLYRIRKKFRESYETLRHKIATEHG